MVHVDDVAGASWALAEWMGKIGRKEADAIAGEEIVFHNEKSKVAEVEGMAPADKKCIAPLFNLVSGLLKPGRRNKTLAFVPDPGMGLILNGVVLF